MLEISTWIGILIATIAIGIAIVLYVRRVCLSEVKVEKEEDGW